MKKFKSLLRTLHSKPWLITSEAHRRLCAVVEHQGDYAPGEMPDDMPEEAAPAQETAGSTAVIPIYGVMSKRVSMIEEMLGLVDVDAVATALIDADTNPGIDSILLHIDSPGGTVAGVPELAEVVRAISKPIVAYTDGDMCSAAYWVASQCDAVYASKSATIGSIGVYCSLLDVSRAYEMAGIKLELFKSGKDKALGVPGSTLTDEQRQFLQAEIDQVYSWFKADVIQGRGAVADDTMQGQWFYGETALGLNLIDAVGSLDDALAEVRDMAQA